MGREHKGSLNKNYKALNSNGVTLNLELKHEILNSNGVTLNLLGGILSTFGIWYSKLQWSNSQSKGEPGDVEFVVF